MGFFNHTPDGLHHLGGEIWLEEDGEVGSIGNHDLFALRRKPDQRLLHLLVNCIHLVTCHAAGNFP